MNLKDYQKKRDFRKTPEPKGKSRKGKGGMSYVIQKHDASRLHYDFRLELDGTLKSWAVPKGPSLNPKEKRLAVHVEDHPIEYGSFEGIIPQEEYGGGTVMVWDRGTWESQDDDSSGAYQDGKMKIVLHGEKLKGGWALVRMGGKKGNDDDNWLLIKENDKFSNAKTDITKSKPDSVASGRSIKDIASEEGADSANGSGKSKRRSSAGGRGKTTRNSPADSRKKKA